MSLGEAFIEVRADMRPFVRDLDRQVRQALQRVEQFTARSLTQSLGEAGEQAGAAAGSRAGTSLSRTMKKSFDEQGSNIFLSLAGALGSALDDGISALPTEVKAAIVAGILLAAPLLGAILGAAVATGLGLGVAGIGILLAAQFEDVRERATEFGRTIRNLLTTAAQSFGPAILNALSLIENRFVALAPVITRIFDSASKFIEPLTAGLLQGLDVFINALDRAIPKLQPFIETFSLGLASTLETISIGLAQLASTGEDGQRALRDLFLIVNALIASFFGVIQILTFVNRLFHEFLDFVLLINPVLRILVAILKKEIPDAQGAVIVSNFSAADSFNGVIAKTKEEEQAARDLVRALDGLVDATFDNIQVDIDFERSLDRITESLKENGRTLDIHTEKGRQNVESFLRGLKDAEERALHRFKVQGYTAEQAAQLYNQEIAQLREVARQAGITDEQFNALFGDIIAVSELRLSSAEMGIDGVSASLDEAAKRARDLLGLIKSFQKSAAIGLLGGFSAGGYADGDIVDRPTLGVFGEAGPEVIIPLTKPARAAELAQKSGLTAMLGNNGSVVMVFIGEEQLETRMVKVVERNNQNQALTLSQGPRRF